MRRLHRPISRRLIVNSHRCQENGTPTRGHVSSKFLGLQRPEDQACRMCCRLRSLQAIANMGLRCNSAAVHGLEDALVLQHPFGDQVTVPGKMADSHRWLTARHLTGVVGLLFGNEFHLPVEIDQCDRWK